MVNELHIRIGWVVFIASLESSACQIHAILPFPLGCSSERKAFQVTVRVAF